MPENGLGQLFHINGIMEGTEGAASDLTKQSELYKNGVKGKLPENEYDDLHTYLDSQGGNNSLNPQTN